LEQLKSLYNAESSSITVKQLVDMYEGDETALAIVYDYVADQWLPLEAEILEDAKAVFEGGFKKDAFLAVTKKYENDEFAMSVLRRYAGKRISDAYSKANARN
uniref:ERAP1_C domain-containing protein n=1 Tax=Mesocestoides corti TaxID=53468 RepID=A0A0R3UAY4_MESCO